MVHSTIQFMGDITKIPTSINLSPYLQSFVNIDIYMPTHPKDIHLIIEMDK